MALPIPTVAPPPPAGPAAVIDPERPIGDILVAEGVLAPDQLINLDYSRGQEF